MFLPYLANVKQGESGLINNTTDGPIKTTSSVVQASSGDVLPQTTTTVLNPSQNTAQVASSKAQSSPQSNLRPIPSQKEDVLFTSQLSSKTTQPISPSSNLVKPLLSTASILAHTSTIGSSISPSG